MIIMQLLQDSTSLQVHRLVEEGAKSMKKVSFGAGQGVRVQASRLTIRRVRRNTRAHDETHERAGHAKA